MSSATRIVHVRAVMDAAGSERAALFGYSEGGPMCVLFTDLVGSTEKARQLCDPAWAQLLGRHHDVLRRELARFGCEEIDTAGDGLLALGEGPTSS